MGGSGGHGRGTEGRPPAPSSWPADPGFGLQQTRRGPFSGSWALAEQDGVGSQLSLHMGMGTGTKQRTQGLPAWAWQGTGSPSARLAGPWLRIAMGTVHKRWHTAHPPRPQSPGLCQHPQGSFSLKTAGHLPGHTAACSDRGTRGLAMTISGDGREVSSRHLQ